MAHLKQSYKQRKQLKGSKITHNDQLEKNEITHRNAVEFYQEDVNFGDEFKRNETSFNLNTQTNQTNRVQRDQHPDIEGYVQKKLVKKSKILGREKETNAGIKSKFIENVNFKHKYQI